MQGMLTSKTGQKAVLGFLKYFAKLLNPPLKGI